MDKREVLRIAEEVVNCKIQQRERRRFMKSLKTLLLMAVLLLSPSFAFAQGENYEFVTMWGSCGSGDYQFGVDLGPRGLVVDEAENLYVADYGNRKIKVFSTSGTFKYSFYSSYVSDMDYANGHLYFTKPNGYACKYTVTGTKVWEKYFSAPGWNLNGICVDSDGNIHVCNSYYNRVYKLDPNTGNLIKEYSVAEGCWQIASDNSGHVYIASGSGPVQRFTNDGVYDNSRLNLPPEERAGGIGVDNQGNIFIGTANYKMRKYDSNWSLLAEWGVQGSGEGQFSGVGGVTVDNQGYVYLSDGGGANCAGMNRRIQVFRPSSGPPQVSIIDMFPVQVLMEEIDVDNDATPELLLEKTTALFAQFSEIPNFSGYVEVSLSAKFGDEALPPSEPLTITYDDGLVSKISPSDYAQYYKDRWYAVLGFLPGELGEFRFQTIVSDLGGEVMEQKTWDQKWEVKETRDFKVGYLKIDNIGEWNFYKAYDSNDGLIKDIFPVKATYEGMTGGKISVNKNYAPLCWGIWDFLSDLYTYGKRRYPSAERIVGIAPNGWIWSKLGCIANGRSWFGIDAVVVEEDVKINGVAHELGHTFGMPQGVYGTWWCLEEGGLVELPTCPVRYADYGFWIETDQRRLRVPSDYNFMGPESHDVWINHESYGYLLGEFLNNPNDPELILLTGRIFKDGYVEVTNLYTIPEGCPSHPVGGQYVLQEEDSSGETLIEIAFSLQFGFVSDSTFIETEFAPFAFSVPYIEGLVQLLIKREDQVLGEIEPLSGCLANAIKSIPEQGFVRNPEQLRNALTNKTHTLEQMLSAGDTTAAKNKLINDILKHLQEWLIEDYPIDSSAIPLQLSKTEIIELINAMLPKIGWYARSDGNLRPTNPERVLPKELSLSRNYPNPFNPVTEIRYALPKDCHVKLSIYNVLGQKVRSLVDEYQSAGDKSAKWNGKDDKGQECASGVYFYRIKAGDYTEAKKMILMK